MFHRLNILKEKLRTHASNALAPLSPVVIASVTAFGAVIPSQTTHTTVAIYYSQDLRANNLV